MSLSNTSAPIESDYATTTHDSTGYEGSLYNQLESDLKSNLSTTTNTTDQSGNIEVPTSLYSMAGLDPENTDFTQALDSTNLRAESVVEPTDSTQSIDWSRFRDNATDAYNYALQTNRPLVLVIGEDWCTHCLNLEIELRNQNLTQFSQDAVFAYVHPSRDPAAQALAQRLGVTAYPVISILEPNSQMIEERARLNGFFTADQLQGHFRDILRRNGDPAPNANRSLVARPTD
ncbi:MAG: thioredoxin fold domain-containing protein [Cyanobacteria bacterium]|nr:thioredoxin fold domain-containing protein [Cyanobacteriota bacterium]